MEDKTSPIEKTKLKPIERVTVDEVLKHKLIQLTQQANDAFQGMASITKSDVMNFILASHSGTFTRLEIKTLKGRHFDEVKFAQWITLQLKTAQANGKAITIAELLRNNPGLLEGGMNKPPSPTRSLRKPKVEKTGEDVKPVPSAD